MNRKDMQSLLMSFGRPVQYMRWKRGQAPELPYWLFRIPSRRDKKADNRNFQKVLKWQIDLYSDGKEEELEEKLEAALDAKRIPYTKHEDYIESEDMLLSRYYINTLGE